jgi:putative transposase
VLLKLAYLGMSSVFAALRLLPMSERDKDVEILALRHQITVLERQLNGQRVGFAAGDRAFLAAPLHHLPQEALLRMRLLVRPDTVLRWPPGPGLPPARRPVPAQVGRPSAHRPLHPGPRTAEILCPAGSRAAK